MEPRDHLPIDIADPQDIRAKLPEAKRLYEAKQRDLARLYAEVDAWANLIDVLARIVGEEPVRRDLRPIARLRAYGGGEGVEIKPPRRKAAPAQDRAVSALELAGQPMGPADLYRFMESQNLSVPPNPNALGAALWSAFKADRVKKTSEGLYAPSDWEPDQPELHASENDLPQPQSEAGTSSTQEAVQRSPDERTGADPHPTLRT